MSLPKDVIYVGDPMCSWCWGIAAEMQKVRQFAIRNKMGFTILVGGLRVGGGQEWNDEFKDMLCHHWEQVTIRSDQPFGYELFDLPEFNYDTEPACRAVVAVKTLLENSESASQTLLDFFVGVQENFYVNSQDPKQLNFYQSICEKLSIDFSAFSQAFNSAEVKAQATTEFNITRKWGVTGYPTLIYSDGEQMYLISSGFQKSEGIIESIEQLADL